MSIVKSLRGERFSTLKVNKQATLTGAIILYLYWLTKTFVGGNEMLDE